jgi:hypothetical protein
MKTIEYEEKRAAQVSKWGEEAMGCVSVIMPGMGWYYIRHESEIPEAWPEAVKVAVLAEVLRRRPAGEDEWREVDATLWQFRIRAGRLEGRFALTHWGPWLPMSLVRNNAVTEAARAWRDKQWQPVEGAEGYAVRLVDGRCAVREPNAQEWIPMPEKILEGGSMLFTCPAPVIAACCKLLGIERPAKKLAENQVRYGGLTFTLRWFDGKPQQQGEDDWVDWKLGGTCFNKCDAWFRKHCPIDRFVTDDGRVLEFVMRDDGQAQTRVDASGSWLQTNIEFVSGPDSLKALYRFRDSERAKWTFEWFDAGNESFIQVRKNDRRDYAFPNWEHGAGWSPKALRELPTWVRTHAEKMWREMEPEWRTEWAQGFQRVEVFRDGNHYGSFDRHGARNVPDDCPPHILTEARAKFRANYTLGKDEAWMGDSPVTMKWEEESGDGPRVVIGNLWFGPLMRPDTWTKGASYWKTDDERIEAFYRCKAMFRANYTLKRDEIWFQWMPTRMVFDIDLDCVCLMTGKPNQHYWHEGRPRENFNVGADDSERLEAWDRMRRYYYEEHPEKGLHPHTDEALIFEMRGERGAAVAGRYCVAMSTETEFSDLWQPLINKLQRWTAAQLEKRGPAMTSIISVPTPIGPARFRITIEPIK